MNILSFDIEEWYTEKTSGSLTQKKYNEFDRILKLILEELERKNTKATFFCLGKIAEEFPKIINLIASRGHEIGCHSHTHTWVNKISPDEFREDTKQAIDAIANVIGKQVKSFRAPAFSICETNKWAFEVLAECGIENDASVFPGARDFGGFPSFTEQRPVKIRYKEIEINEFPIPIGTIPLFGKKMAFSGGGYFRLLPYSFVRRMMNKNDYNMCYFHIGDVLKDKIKFLSRKEYEDYFKENGSLKNRMIRYFKSNIGRNTALNNLLDLISSYDFVSIEQYINLNPSLPQLDLVLL